MSDELTPQEAAAARFFRDTNARLDAMRKVEDRLLAEMPMVPGSIIGRQIEPIAQFVEEKLNSCGPICLAVMHGSAALQFRILRRRKRAARQEALQHRSLRDHKAAQREDLSVQKGHPTSQVTVVVHAATSVNSVESNATPETPGGASSK